MDLLAQLRVLTSVPTARRVRLPLRPASATYEIAWLDVDAPDAWESYPELDDVASELAVYLPLADVTIGDDHKCLLVAREAPHAVYLFDDGFQLISASLDAFLAPAAAAEAPPPAFSPADQLASAMAAGAWAEARAAIEIEMKTWKSPDDLTALRATYARILAELGDRVAGDKLVTEHVGYLRWLAKDERPRALELQARFGALLDAAAVSSPNATSLLATIRAGIIAELPAPAPPAGVSADDISTAVRLVRGAKVMQLRSLLERLPALVETAELGAAFAELAPSRKKDELAELVKAAHAALAAADRPD